MWSCVLQFRHTGLAAAAVPGLNALWSSCPGYWSSTQSRFEGAAVRARYCQPSFGAKRPPKARSTTYWSSSAKACERGTLCSRVKPCGIISLSQAGFGEGRWSAISPSARAVPVHLVQRLELLLVAAAAGRRDPSASRAAPWRRRGACRCLRGSAADALVLAAAWNALIGSWQP